MSSACMSRLAYVDARHSEGPVKEWYQAQKGIEAKTSRAQSMVLADWSTAYWLVRTDASCMGRGLQGVWLSSPALS